MNSPANGTPLHQPALDWLFARLGGNPDPENAPSTEDRCDDPPATEEVGPPPINSPEDLRIAAEWVQRERQRLEAYTRTQLARIHQEHQTLLQQNYYYEQGLILRSQEVAHKEEMLLAQGRAIDQQVQDLARREQDLVGQLQNWWQANEELAALQEVTQTAHQDSATQRALLQALQAETAALQSARESARTELQGLIAATEDMRQTRAKEEAAMKARQTQLEQRLLAAEQAILAADQRQAELDDLSSRLQHESEQQERDREQRQRVLDALEDRLRTELDGLDASRAQLDRRHSAVGEAEVALGQRQRELDELHEQLVRVQTEVEEQFQELQRPSLGLPLHEQQPIGWEQAEEERAVWTDLDGAPRMKSRNRPARVAPGKQPLSPVAHSSGP